MLLSCPLMTTPRVPRSMSFSTPGDGGAELMSVTTDMTSVRSEVMSKLTSELGSDSTPLVFWGDWKDGLPEANVLANTQVRVKTKSQSLWGTSKQSLF